MAKNKNQQRTSDYRKDLKKSNVSNKDFDRLDQQKDKDIKKKPDLGNMPHQKNSGRGLDR